MTPQDNTAPGLEEQVAYIGESIDGECGCFMCRHNRAILASLEQLASLQARLAEVEGLRGALQTVDSDIDYALRRANTNGDGSMDHLSATRLIKALATIKAALAGERK